MTAFEWIFGLSTTVAVVLLPLSILVLRLTLDKRVRRQLPEAKVYENYPDWYGGFGRTIIFACASISKRANNSWQMKEFYNGFNIKGFANQFERIMAFCLFLSILVSCVAGILLVFLEMIGVK